MIDGIHNAAEGMSVSIIQQEIIANNLANLNTTGFKSGKIFLRMLENAQESNQQLQEQQVYDYQQGALQNTGGKWDFALVGDGFFVVESAQGIRYTRNGAFHLDTNSFLTASEGTYVLGEKGPIQVDKEMSVTKKGEIYVDGRLVDRLRIVDFNRPYHLMKLSDSQFVVDDDLTSLREPDNISVRQGFLEQSNVNAIDEMISMISVFRNFEAGSKALKMNDETLEKAINEMGVIR